MLHQNKNLCFALRYVTRPGPDQGRDDEGDLAVSQSAFAQHRLSGLFALDWQAHGCSYGIGIEINTELRSGMTVVVNGSRAYAATALKKYPVMTVVQIVVSQDVARTRLTTRAREDAAAIDARVRRAPPVFVPDDQLVTIDNGGPLEVAAVALTAVLLRSDRTQLVSHGTFVS